MKRKRKRVTEKSVRAVTLTNEEVLRKSMDHRDFIWFECVKEKNRSVDLTSVLVPEMRLVRESEHVLFQR